MTTETSPRPTALERAFALAADGGFVSAHEIKLQLESEGFPREQIATQIAGPALHRQIRVLCISARKRPKAG
jgi:hypothetical protein